MMASQLPRPALPVAWPVVGSSRFSGFALLAGCPFLFLRDHDLVKAGEAAPPPGALACSWLRGQGTSTVVVCSVFQEVGK